MSRLQRSLFGSLTTHSDHITLLEDAQPVETVNIPPPRGLVVDDTEDNLFLMTSLMEDKHQMLVASSGSQAM